jgi:hypothetical protein
MSRLTVKYFAATCALGLGLVLVSSLVSAQTSFSTNVRVGFQAGDDWEPHLVGDNAGHLYVLITHLSDSPPQTSCPGCANHLLVQRSDDSGNTWNAPVMIDSVGSSQFDPWMVLDPDGTTIWISYMNNVVNSGSALGPIDVVKSTNLGTSWSTPVQASSSRMDKDAMAIRGGTMAVCFDDFTKGYAAISTNGGATWSQHVQFAFKNAPLQFLCSGAAIDSAGNIFFSWDESTKNSNPGSTVWVERSSDGGNTWTQTIIDNGGTAPPCSHCGAGAYFGAQMSLSIGSDDTIYLLYNMSADLTNGAPQRIYFRKSTDHGNTYSARQDVSLAATGVENSFPTVLGGSTAGDVRVAWQDNRNSGSWNTMYRSSTNGGASFSPESFVSNYVPGYSYLTTSGYQFPYGDYIRMALDSAGKVHLAWGEAPCYKCIGNIWVGNQQ